MMGLAFFGVLDSLVGFWEAWRRLLMDAILRYGRACPVKNGRTRPRVLGYDVINRAPFRVSLGGVLPSRARFRFAEIL